MAGSHVKPGTEIDDEPSNPGRRDFLLILPAAFVMVGAAAAMWPFIDSFEPAADVQALAKVDVDLAPIALGQRITVSWQGKPVFIDHRTKAEIDRARADDGNPDLINPQKDEDRVKRAEWLIVVGICTHLGCIPLGQRKSDPKGQWGGWFCPCHGSQYDRSGRVRHGPAPRNLLVPPYEFIGPEKIRIG